MYRYSVAWQPGYVVSLTLHVIHFNILRGENGELQFLFLCYSRLRIHSRL